jgi:hypothetical protein
VQEGVFLFEDRISMFNEIDNMKQMLDDKRPLPEHTVKSYP